jgi:hypothetical protein
MYSFYPNLKRKEHKICTQTSTQQPHTLSNAFALQFNVIALIEITITS